MKIRLVAAVLASLTFLAGMADAAPPSGRDDSLVILDLTPVDGGVYFLMCETLELRPTTSPADCRRISVWEDSNPVPRLQSTAHTIGSVTYVADSIILA